MHLHSFISEMLASRYPFVVADEHQDSSNDQHAIIMALGKAGAKLRIFGDPMQDIYSSLKADQGAARWEEIKALGAFAELRTPHRWRYGTPALGEWILTTREALKDGRTIDVSRAPPDGIRILHADNVAKGRGYRLSPSERAPIDRVTRSVSELLILTPQNDMTKALAAFWNRTISVWEGHTSSELDRLVTAIDESSGDAVRVARAVVKFMENIASGFSPKFQERNCLKSLWSG